MSKCCDCGIVGLVTLCLKCRVKRLHRLLYDIENLTEAIDPTDQTVRPMMIAAVLEARERKFNREETT